MGLTRPAFSMKRTSYALLREASLTQGILKDNLTAHCGNAITCLSIRLLYVTTTSEQALALVPGVTLTAFAFAYSFDIANQVFSIKEDSVNKPHRPIPSGEMSFDDAYIRWLLSWLILPVALYAAAGLRAATLLLLWEGWVSIFYIWPKLDNWFARNLFTAVGAVNQLRLLDAVIAHNIPSFETRGSLDWLLFCWLLMTIHVQEFHDMDGDRSVGRRTLPLLLGPRSRLCLRVVTAIVMLVVAMMNVGFFERPIVYSKLVSLLGLCHVLSMLTLAVRLVVLHSKEADEVTYKYYYTSATYIMLIFHAHARDAIGWDFPSWGL